MYGLNDLRYQPTECRRCEDECLAGLLPLSMEHEDTRFYDLAHGGQDLY